ncbi:cytochrome P450 26A1 isoform X1 [Ciona intestinalis]
MTSGLRCENVLTLRRSSLLEKCLSTSSSWLASSLVTVSDESINDLISPRLEVNSSGSEELVTINLTLSSQTMVESSFLYPDGGGIGKAIPNISSLEVPSNRTLTNYLESEDFFYLLFFLIKYIGVPCFLMHVVCCLWEIRCVRMKDHSCPLPLPRGNMGFPLVGEMFHLFVVGANYQRQRRSKYGKIYRTHMFGSPSVAVIGEEHVKKIVLGEGTLVQTRWPSTTRRILGTDGIVNGDLATHCRIKRLALKAFSPKYIGTYAPVIQAGVAAHVKEWVDQGTVHILEKCKQAVSKTMMTVLLGIKSNDPDIQLYIQAADDIINSILSLPLDLPGFGFHRGLKARELIFNKLESQLKSKFNATDDELFGDNGGEFESVLLNILKFARREGETEIKLRNLQNLSLEFIFAGTQSLQCSCSLVTFHLSQNPQVVEQCREEIKAAGLWDTPLTEIKVEHIQSLRFIELVAKETLRVTPTIPGAVRVALKTFELGGYQIPKGWQIIYSIRLTHEEAAGKVLQDGSKCEFEPGKHFTGTCKNTEVNKSGEDKSHKCLKQQSPYAFLPFGKGPRMCAGKNYGMLFLKVLIFELVRTADISLEGKCKIIEVPMTRTDKSVKIKFTSIRKLKTENSANDVSSSTAV